jgi:hypothetical protein
LWWSSSDGLAFEEEKEEDEEGGGVARAWAGVDFAGDDVVAAAAAAEEEEVVVEVEVAFFGAIAQIAKSCLSLAKREIFESGGGARARPLFFERVSCCKFNGWEPYSLEL